MDARDLAGRRFGLRFWLLTSAAWGLLVLAYSGAVAADLVRGGRPVEWARIVGGNLLLYSPWVPITAGVFWWLARHPVPRRRALWPRWLWAQLGLLAAWIVLYPPVASVLTALARFGSPRRALEVMTTMPATAWVLDSILLFATVGVASTAGVWTAARRRERQAARLAVENAELAARLAETRLQLLRAQLEPHFLYNALNTVAALIRSAEPATAVRAVGTLSELLRYATQAAARQRVQVAEEVDFVEAYLAFQELRFGDRLSTELTIDPLALEGQLPPLVLQPLLDNAIRHGVEQIEAASRIELTVERHGERLELRVRNEPVASACADDGLGVGLENTRRRLEATFGPTATLGLRRDAKAAVATLEVPWCG
ncbi:MAG: histidine kinase [Acidobacteriota bacterium]